MNHILTEQQQHLLVVKLNRSEKFNSFNRTMALELISVLDKAKKDDNIRAIIITGEGKAFCAGEDLAEAIDPNGPGIEKIVSEHYNPIILKIREMPKPVIAAVNGVAAGAGANIALACDIIFATKSSSFIQAFSKIALIPDSGGTYTLPRILGFPLASALMMTGDKLTAEDAQKFGLVYKVFEDAEFMNECMSNGHRLSEMPTKALALTKRLLNESYSHSLSEQLQMEKELQIESADSHDYKEGVEAFLQKRKPVFKGN